MKTKTSAIIYGFKLSMLTVICFYVTLAEAQNRARFHHIIRHSEVANGHLPLVYNDGTDHILYGSSPDPNFNLCSDVKAIVSLGSNGIANVDIFSFTTNSPSPCINMSTRLGANRSFRLDITRDSLGDPTYVYIIPFRLKTWSVATVPFRYRFKTDSSFSTVTTNLSAV